MTFYDANAKRKDKKLNDIQETTETKGQVNLSGKPVYS